MVSHFLSCLNIFHGNPEFQIFSIATFVNSPLHFNLIHFLH
jgi:hypothetical protein